AGGFFAALGLFVGYLTGAAFVITATLKPIFPANVGLFVIDGIPRSFGAEFPVPRGAEVWGGYWLFRCASPSGSPSSSSPIAARGGSSRGAASADCAAVSRRGDFRRSLRPDRRSALRGREPRLGH